jgi:NTE family protein
MPTDPVETISTEDAQRVPEHGTALCLSGGGYRAMVFHIGVLWRLYETGLLGACSAFPAFRRLDTAGVLALKWRRLSFDRRG